MRRPVSPIHIRAPAEVLDRIDEIAARRRVSRSRVILDAVRKQLDIPPRDNVFDETPAA